MEEENPKTTGKTVTIIILMVLLLGALGFIGYDKLLGKNNESTIAEQKQKEKKGDDSSIKKLTKDSQEVKDLMNTFINPYDCDDQGELFKLNEKSAKLYMAYTRAHHIQKISCSKVQNLVYNSNMGLYTCGDLTEEISSYSDNNGSLIVNDTLNEKLKMNATDIVNKSDFDKKMKELFGENIDYSYEDIIMGMGCVIVHYDPSVESYVKYVGYNCGGTCGLNTITLKDIKQDGENLSLVVDLFGDDDSTQTFKYHFKLENEHYIFVNME